MTEVQEKVVRSARTFLSRWRGATAQMWELTTSHKTLRIVLHEKDRPGNLVLACLDPQRIEGPVLWFGSDLEVEAVQAEGPTAITLVRDEKVGLRVLCGWLEVRENVKLS